ncbi:MAG TPA: hemerythrin domain-containing protein [Pyrinomonadaceae bacterium]|nr:hemerythrin domain-containing protein [Pyrinomonadaceae bacterium]
MDAFELLKKDHRKVSQLFSEIESANGQAKAKLFSQLKSELDLHAHIEEAVLYPALENTDEAREITLEAYEEHKVVKDLLAELAGAGEHNDEWDAKLTVLKENVEHHVEEEEGELFDKARKALGDERIETLGAELESAKARNTKSKPRRTSQTKKAAPKKSGKTESPGVLQRLASFIGLGDTSASTSTSNKRAAASGGKGKARSTSKSASKRSAAKSSKSTGSKSAKPPSKAALKGVKTKGAKKSAARSGSKSRSSSKATPARKTSTSSRSRTSATKNASRAASNQKVKPSGGRRKAAKVSTKTGSRSR